MRQGTLTIYNFNGKKGDIFEEAKEQTEVMKKAELEIDEITITFTERPKFQSDPKEGNLLKKPEVLK